MLQRINQFLSSKSATVILLLIYAVLMAVATIIEKSEGTQTAKTLVYYSPAFILLHILMVINCVALTLKHRLLRKGKWGYVTTHAAMIVILTGATVTHFWGGDGTIHLREGEHSNIMVCRENGRQTVHELPFEVELTDFTLVRYPGSQSPSSYESDVKIHDNGRVTEFQIYMNRVLDYGGYRFFQASYDADEQGSILSVNHDVAGRLISYWGYFLLTVGLIGCLIGKGSRFRMLCRQLKVIALIAVAGVSFRASAQEIPVEHAEQFGKLPMLSVQGRIVPVNTFASELVRKLKIKESPLTPEQMLLGILTRPAQWASTPLITIRESDIRKNYTDGQHVISYRDAFDSRGHYKYAKDVERVYRMTPSLRTHTDRELLKLDERIQLLHRLFNYELLRMFPVPQDSINHRWLAAGDNLSQLQPRDSAQVVGLMHNYINACASQDMASADRILGDIRQYQMKNHAGLDIDTEKIEAEVRYNRLNLEARCKLGYLISGALLLLLAVMGWFSGKESKAIRYATMALCTVVGLVFLLHTYSLGMRWYISGHAPWSNSYETMIFMAWTGVLGGFCFLHTSRMTMALATVFAGVVLFVAGLNWMDPEITGLVPVLKSPWLMFHVAVLMTAYGFMGVGAMISTLNLVSIAIIGRSEKHDHLREQVRRLSIINELALTIGMALMMVGIFLGAVWANESWGRYWSWDPKETWALITAVVYAAVLHRRWLSPSKDELWFNIGGQWAFLTVLMTYFGVNYLLSGMHSYGNVGGLADLHAGVYIAFVLLFFAPVSAALIRRRRTKK